MLELIPIVFCFSRREYVINTRVSEFLGVVVSEKTNRPIYYHWRRMVYKGKEYDALFYSLFWSINPGYKIFGKVVGFHEADVETVVILHDVDNHKPVWVHFGAHGRGQGTWLPYEKCKFTDNGHLIVHVAPESHGLYPMAKTYYRICCLANDRCRTDGEIWFPMKDDFEDARKQTWSNTHYQVRRGINSPLNVSMPGENSITFIERLFLFLPNVMKKIRK